MSSLHTNQTFFDIGEEYAVQEVIGEGAYSVVRSAIHKPTGQKVAIKKISPFGYSMFCLRTMRELVSLRHFHHENTVSILGVQKPRSYEDFQDVYHFQELMETDMHSVLRNEELSDAHCQYFTCQILRAVKANHSADVLHCDLKPSNLLLNSNCDLKVCGFGFARLAATAGTRHGSSIEFVGSRWYRAPEVMLTPGNNTTAIDMWSIGCILAEMLSCKPLFPGKNFWHQLTLIFDVLGTPTVEDTEWISSELTRAEIRSLPFKSKIQWKNIFPRASDLALDLLERMLTFDPLKRISAQETLEHPYLASYHNPGDEPIAASIPEKSFDFDKKISNLSKEHLKGEVSLSIQFLACPN
jgi:mitogen-activated protein kinase 1/3